MGLSGNFKYNIFTNIQRFEEHLKNNPSQLKKIQWSKTSELLSTVDEFGKHTVSINFQAIYKQILNPSRYNEISVIIVDYAMPECNGIQLCNLIRKINPHVKTLLLTGEADNQIAVDAFNNKLIDKFLIKENIDTLWNKIDAAIAELSQEYFYHILENLIFNITDKNSLITNKSYIKLFQSVYDQHQACEYYMVDASGGYLMLNGNGDAKWLIAKNMEDVEVYTDLSQNEDELDQNLLEQIEQKQVIPFYHGEYLNLPQHQWGDHLLPAEKLVTDVGCYLYALDNGFSNSIIKKDSFQAYRQYNMAEF